LFERIGDPFLEVFLEFGGKLRPNRIDIFPDLSLDLDPFFLGRYAGRRRGRSLERREADGGWGRG
jgi:hypothetical protein